MEIEVSPRHVLGRRGRVYDARAKLGKDSIEATGITPADARRKVRAIADYIAGELAAEWNGFRLAPSTTETEQWWLSFPGGGSLCFAAKTFGDAHCYLLGQYDASHPVREFLRECHARPALEIL